LQLGGALLNTMPRTPGSTSRRSALSIVAASVGTLVIGYALFSAPREHTAEMLSVPVQPESSSQWVAAPSPSAPPPAQPPAPPIDARGFVGSAARCDDAQRAVAAARTARSAVVVCEATDGRISYRGVRLEDGAVLSLYDVRPIPAGFEARNDGTTYRLSPTELVVISGEALQSRDPVVQYQAS
jgi:hypothetical protein